MSENTAGIYVLKWFAAEPEMELAQVFCPPGDRTLFRLWGGLVNELDLALLEFSEERVAQAKLAWWGEELTRGAQGKAQHPLVRALFEQKAAKTVNPASWPTLGVAACQTAVDEGSPTDVDDLLARFNEYALALARVEAQLFQASSVPDAIAIHQALRQITRALREHPARMRWPLNLLARYQVDAVELERAPLTPHAAALRVDLAQSLHARLASASGGALFRRCRSLLDRQQLKRLARGRGSTGTMVTFQALWALWRGLRRAYHP